MNRPQGTITTPPNNALVPRRFHAEGSVNNLSAGQHLFLVVEIDGLMWPKGKVQWQDTSWTGEVLEGGDPPEGRFTLSLFAVGGKGFEAVTAWLKRGEATDSYPGLVNIDESIRLHSVRLRLA